jgi:flagellin FlaB
MEKKYMERLIGRYCKIVTKEPGEKRASVVTGTLEDVDYKDGFVLVDSDQGLGCLRINTIIAIKPGRKHKLENEKRKFKKNEKAAVGIGTLIVFIAMVLVAAVAASVLINTAEKLQSKAEAVGSQTITEVSAGLAIDDITGYTNEDRTIIEYLAITVRPRAGTQYMDMTLCTLTVLNDDESVLELNVSLVQPVNLDNKSLFYTPDSPGSDDRILDYLTSTEYGLVSIHDPDETITSTQGMNSGDRAVILVNLSAILPDEGGLTVREHISGSLTPELGTRAVYEINAPALFESRIVELD